MMGRSTVMKKFIALSLLAAFLMAIPATAAPSQPGDASTAVQVLTDAQMTEIVGGGVNLAPAQPVFECPTPPIGPYIKGIRAILGTDPGHFSTAMNVNLGFANFVRAVCPHTDAQGLGHIYFYDR